MHSSNHPYRLAARLRQRPDTIVEVGPASTRIGGTHTVVIAGPCAVEDRDSLLANARALAAAGVPLMRGGAYKPRTSPYSFQGLGERGLELLAEAKRETGIGIVTEVLAVEDVDRVAAVADVLQIGTRNMANYRLLEAVGAAGKPVLLKRGMGSTIEEFLCAAEYILAAGNPDVILCERGVRTFEPLLRNALDLNAVALLRELTHLPVIVDPSHAAGRASLVHRLSIGCVAAGAHGVIVEAHVDPAAALVDGEQSIHVTEVPGLVRAVDAAGQLRADVPAVELQEVSA
jgi:3-deoxy-7-phosphoheptulonate synthase